MVKIDLNIFNSGGDGYDGSGLGIEAAAAAAAAAGAGGGEVQRLRNFAVTSKGVINRGDSFRSKANNSRSLQASAKVSRRLVVDHFAYFGMIDCILL